MRIRPVSVMIVTAVDPAFSAGGNVKDMAAKQGMFGGSPAKVMENYRKNIQRIPLAVHEVEVPTIAAVNGPAIGAGCDLALMCDMRIASERAKIRGNIFSRRVDSRGWRGLFSAPGRGAWPGPVK